MLIILLSPHPPTPQEDVLDLFPILNGQIHCKELFFGDNVQVFLQEIVDCLAHP
jgi:hypothetical protein